MKVTDNQIGEYRVYNDKGNKDFMEFIEQVEQIAPLDPRSIKDNVS